MHVKRKFRLIRFYVGNYPQNMQELGIYNTSMSTKYQIMEASGGSKLSNLLLEGGPLTRDTVQDLYRQVKSRYCTPLLYYNTITVES